MEDNKVTYVVLESICTRLERSNERLWKLCIIIFLAFIVSNCLWLGYESYWQNGTVTTTNEVSQDVNSDGDANVGDVNINGNEN